MPTEDQSRPRRDLRGLWLLPILALGLGVFVTSLKKPARHPTGIETTEQAKRDIYRESKYLLMGRVAYGQPKGFTVVGFAPYSDGSVTEVGPTRYLCSSSLMVRSKAGEMQKELWQCVLTGDHDSWTLEGFRRTPPARIVSDGAQKSATVAGKQ